MAGLMDELISILEQECSDYENLTEMSKEKTPVIIKGDISRLQEITEQEQIITSRIQNLEKKRLGVVNDIAIVISRDSKELTIDNLVKALEKQPEEQKRLRDIQVKLREVLKEMAKVNEENEILLKQSLEMVEFDLELFKSLRQAHQTANYNKNAYNTGTLLGGNGFDTKQ